MCLQHRFDFPCRISTWLCNLARLVSATHVLAQQLHWSGTYKGKHCAPATLQAAGCVHSHRMQGVGNGRKSVLGADACDASLAVVELLLSLSVPLATAEGDQIIFARNKPSKQNPATPPNTVLQCVFLPTHVIPAQEPQAQQHLNTTLRPQPPCPPATRPTAALSAMQLLDLRGGPTAHGACHMLRLLAPCFSRRSDLSGSPPPWPNPGQQSSSICQLSSCWDDTPLVVLQVRR